MRSNPSIPLQGGNVLDNQLKISRAAAMDQQTRASIGNQLSNAGASVGNALAQFSPAGQQVQRNALQRDGMQANADQSQFIAQLLEGVANSPDPARAYGIAVQQAQASGVDIPDGLEAYDPETFQVVRSLYSMPAEKRTALERQYELLMQTQGPDIANQWLLTEGGLIPDANTMFRAETQGSQAPSGFRSAGDGLEAIPGGPADPATIRAQSEARGKRNGITIGPDGTVQIGGPVPLGRAASNQEQKSLATETNLLSRMGSLGEMLGIGPDGRMSTDARDMLTYQSQATDWLANRAEKLGVDVGETQREAIRFRTQFNTTVEQLFNAYRQEITGAAAAVAELERLKKSFLNIDMGPTQLEAAYEQYSSELQRSMRVRNKLIRQGFDPSTEEDGKVFDREFLAGGDDTPEERFAELMAGGADEETAYNTMRQEGY